MNNNKLTVYDILEDKYTEKLKPELLEIFDEKLIKRSKLPMYSFNKFFIYLSDEQIEELNNLDTESFKDLMEHWIDLDNELHKHIQVDFVVSDAYIPVEEEPTIAELKPIELFKIAGHTSPYIVDILDKEFFMKLKPELLDTLTPEIVEKSVYPEYFFNDIFSKVDMNIVNQLTVYQFTQWILEMLEFYNFALTREAEE